MKDEFLKQKREGSILEKFDEMKIDFEPTYKYELATANYNK
jgi:hypothetical protein